MTLPEFYNAVRNRFPKIAAKADEEQFRLLGDTGPDYMHTWFESLANVLNADMRGHRHLSRHADLFRYMGEAYNDGDAQVKDCIDVAFTENLFWDVPARQAEVFWDALPETLKSLYIAFHGRTPL